MNSIIVFILICCVRQIYGSKKVIGGIPATIDQYAFMADLIISMDVGEKMCGGTILSTKFVLTAGHCLENYPVKISVNVGSTFIEQGQSYTTTHYKLHPQYKSDTMDFDIGLVVMDAAITLSAKTKAKVVLLTQTQLTKASNIVVLGWGSRKNGSTQYSPSLMQATVPIVSKDECIKRYALHSFVVTPRMFCAGDITKGGLDACEGDSGGPALNHAGVQVGIVSNGLGCGDPTSPGIYTDLASLRSWVRAETGV